MWHANQIAVAVGAWALPLVVPVAYAQAQQPAGSGHELHSAPAPPQGAWSKLAPFPEPTEEVLGATANDKLYVFAGLAPAWKPKALVFEYDPATNKWTQKSPMPLASHHVALATHDNKIYVFGGFKLPESGQPSWVPLNEAWEYDPAVGHCSWITRSRDPSNSSTW